MIISRTEFLRQADLDGDTLEIWIREEWIVPHAPTAQDPHAPTAQEPHAPTAQENETEPAFTEADLARARLIRELKRDFGVNDEGIGVILNLLDQVHGLRGALAAMCARKD